MSTKTRPARKVRPGDMFDVAGQGVTVNSSYECAEGIQHIRFAGGGYVHMPADAPLNVQRPKPVKAEAETKQSASLPASTLNTLVQHRVAITRLETKGMLWATRCSRLWRGGIGHPQRLSSTTSRQSD